MELAEILGVDEGVVGELRSVFDDPESHFERHPESGYREVFRQTHGEVEGFYGECLVEALIQAKRIVVVDWRGSPEEVLADFETGTAQFGAALPNRVDEFGKAFTTAKQLRRKLHRQGFPSVNLAALSDTHLYLVMDLEEYRAFRRWVRWNRKVARLIGLRFFL